MKGSAPELDDLDRAAREHLDDPRTLVLLGVCCKCEGGHPREQAGEQPGLRRHLNAVDHARHVAWGRKKAT